MLHHISLNDSFLKKKKKTLNNTMNNSIYKHNHNKCLLSINYKLSSSYHGEIFVKLHILLDCSVMLDLMVEKSQTFLNLTFKQ